MDLRLFMTLIRFDAVYVVYFKTNVGSIEMNYPNLLEYCKDVYQFPGMAKAGEQNRMSSDIDAFQSDIRSHMWFCKSYDFGYFGIGCDTWTGHQHAPHQDALLHLAPRSQQVRSDPSRPRCGLRRRPQTGQAFCLVKLGSIGPNGRTFLDQFIWS